MSGILAASLVACAPEPMAGSHVKGQDIPEDERSWSQIDDQDDPSLKSTELPEGFPEADFVLPEDAVIDDAGARGDRAWFVVLKAADTESANAWWDQVIHAGGFVVRDEETGDDGSLSATLASNQLTVAALSIPREDGSVLLSYDITQEFAG